MDRSCGTGVRNEVDHEWSGDRTVLDLMYSPSSLVPDAGIILKRCAERSRRAREDLLIDSDVAYGPRSCERLDLFGNPGTSQQAPVLAYVHGGYWQELSKDVSAFAAPDLVPAGLAVAVIGYGLAPDYQLDEITSMVRRAVGWLIDNAPALGLEARRIHLAGSSAGAHLVAEAVTGQTAEHRRLRESIAGVILLSGIYELEPLISTYVNDALRLDTAAASRCSPLRRDPLILPPAVIARGGVETEAFIREHATVVEWWARRAPVTDLVVEHRNHFDLPLDIGSRASSLGQAVRSQLGIR